ncbi:MAG: acyltransferase family protein [Actinomycetaceae bacterium]|nr:acyltransferase family protein [Actinomycetaceae bacterium]
MHAVSSPIGEVLAPREEGLTQPKRPEERAPARYLRGLNGLRALAAAAVLGYHLVPNTVRGGFLGVDVFFVLSGFLITALLIREHKRFGRINLKAFWLRRIRRLLPAVALMAVVTLIVAGLLDRDLLVGILPQFLGVLTFSYNWVEISRGVSYFDQADPHLWTNVWSLAVEQQFYLIWPLIAVGVLLLNRRWRPLVPLVLAALSAGEMAWLVTSSGEFTRAYQGTDSHAFGLMLGAAFTFLLGDPLGQRRPAGRRMRLLRGVVAWVSLAAIVWAWFVVPDNRAFTYPWATLIVVVATIGLIQGLEMDEGDSLLAKILDLRLLNWLGERSYGIYLWHWPVWVMTVKMLPHAPLWVIALIVVGVSVAAAALSYTYVEVPMRQTGIGETIKRWLGPTWDLLDPEKPMPKEPQWQNYHRILAPGLVGVLIVGTMLGFLLSAPDKTSAQIAVERGQQALAAEEESAAGAEKPTDPPAEAGPATGANTVVYGDSVTVAAAEHLQDGLPGVQIDAEVSRWVYQGIELMSAASEDGSLRPYVVVALATNGPIEPEQLDEMLEALGPNRRLVLVTGFGPARTSWIEPTAQLIREFAAEHPDNVRVADWNAAIRDHTDLLASDYVHPTEEGAEIFAKVVLEALASFETE